MFKSATYELDKFCKCENPKLFSSLESNPSRVVFFCVGCDETFTVKREVLYHKIQINKTFVNVFIDESVNQCYTRWKQSEEAKRIQELKNIEEISPEKNKIEWYRKKLEKFLEDTCQEEIVVPLTKELVH